MTRLENADWSTINLVELRKLPAYHLPPTYYLQKGSGNGGLGDPPGFPTYFTQSVYTGYGNTPPRGYSLVIRYGATTSGITPARWEGDWETHKSKQEALMRRLWIPLPLNHPRTVAWIQATFAHHQHCYQDSRLAGNWTDKSIIFPVPAWQLKTFADDKRFSDEWRTKERAAIKQANAEIRAQAKAAATPDNHEGTILVRKYYPDFQPTKRLMINDFPAPGNWWETMAECPTPETCPGQYGHPHPVNEKWCQMCGWSSPDA